MNIVVNDLLTNYQLTGKGRLVVILHGWGDGSQSWRNLAEHLKTNYQVLRLDLPGFGDTEAPRSAWNLDNYAEFTQAVLIKLKLGQPYGLVGHSHGGAVAIRAVGLKLLKPQKLILIASAGIRASQTGKRLLLQILAKTGNVATIWMPERYRRDLRKSLYRAAGSDMLVTPQLQETFKRIVRQDVQVDAAQIDTSTLIIHGDNDRTVSLANSQKLHSLIKNSQLENVSEAGHFVHVDQPTKLTTLVEGFLK